MKNDYFLEQLARLLITQAKTETKLKIKIDDIKNLENKKSNLTNDFSFPLSDAKPKKAYTDS